MTDKITWLPLTLTVLLLISCQHEQEISKIPVDPTPVVARAGGLVFHESDIDRELRAMPGSLQHLSSDPMARGQILNVLIRRAVLSQQAEEVGLDSDPLILSRINRARNTILIEALENWQTSQIPIPKEQEINSYYRAHLKDFTIPEQIHARHILLGSEKLAWEVQKKVAGNRENFEALAATYSLDDSNKSRGGDLNWFPRGIMVKAFEQVAFALKENGISQPVKTQFGWHIIEVLGKRPSYTKSLDESRDEIIGILQQQKLDEWVSTLVDRANVKILKAEYQSPVTATPEAED
ncbi:MAG: peptidylprolyl isomerase [Mariprofundaceae bacterium]|nr:peptidylprolyl isomerase [Mariprofundaceae bacterium]